MHPAIAYVLLFVCCAGYAQPALVGSTDLSSRDVPWVAVTGLQAGSVVEVETRRAAEYDPKSVLVGRAAFNVDATGAIDTRTAAPLRGSYTNVDAAGVFWSAVVEPKSQTDAELGPSSVRVDARVDDRIVASRTIRSTPPDEQLHVETQTPFPGAVFVRPAGAGRYPAIVVLGGSEGGSWTARHIAPLLAAKGYAVLGLPYYSPPYDPTDQLDGLPKSFTDIPVDRLATAHTWLQARTDVAPRFFGIWGASKGAEFALIAASRYDWITAVVAIVPSDVVWEGWGQDGPATGSFAFDGRTLPYVRYAGMDAELAKAAQGQRMDLRRVHVEGRAAHGEDVRGASIPIERYRGALLLVAGEDDRIWPSADMARTLQKKREAAGLDSTLLTFANVGHALSGPGAEPVGSMVGLGGQAPEIAQAREQAWSATFRLFERASKGARRVRSAS